MIQKPMDVLQLFPVRKSRKQKQAFRDAAVAYLQELGYAVAVEEGKSHSRNILAGDPRTAKYLVTAHYDTCAGMLVPNLITPCSIVPFIFYQLFVTALILVPAILLGDWVGNWTRNPQLGWLVYMVLLWGCLILMLVGPANRHNANDNTSGVVAVLEIAKSMPTDQRHKVCFVLFDLEEAGLIGSSSYRKAHRAESENQMVLNLDCVGDGDEIRFFPTKGLKKNGAMMAALERCCGSFGAKRVDIRRKGFAFYPSDQKHFPCGVGICALHDGPFGLYLGRIHTCRDTVLEETNINILRAGLISMIACAPLEKGKE